MFKISEGYGVFGIVLGLCGLGWAAYQSKKMNDAAKKINTTVDEMADKTPVEIEQSMIDKALEVAVDRAVSAKASAAVSELKKDIHNEIEKEVRRELTDSLKEIRDRVSEEIKDQADQIDKDEVLKDVTRKLTDELKIEGKKELNHRLTGIVNDLSSSLASYKKLHDGLMEALSPRHNDSGREVSFRLN